MLSKKQIIKISKTIILCHFISIWNLGSQIKVIKQPEDADGENRNFHSLPDTGRTKVAGHIVRKGKSIIHIKLTSDNQKETIACKNKAQMTELH